MIELYYSQCSRSKCWVKHLGTRCTVGILKSSMQWFCTRPAKLKYQGKPFHTRDTGQKCQVQGPFTMDPMSKGDKNKPKGRGKKIRLYFTILFNVFNVSWIFCFSPSAKASKISWFPLPRFTTKQYRTWRSNTKKQRILPFYIIWVHRLLKHVCLLQSKYFHSDKQVLIL